MTLNNIDDLPRQFCFGKNTSVDLSSQDFYIQKSKNKFVKLDGRLDQNIVTALTEANPGNVEAIDGGQNCFGDSGKIHTYDLRDTLEYTNCFLKFGSKFLCQPGFSKSNLLLLYHPTLVCTHKSLSNLICEMQSKICPVYRCAFCRRTCVLPCWRLWWHYSGRCFLLHALGHLQGPQGAILRHAVVLLSRLDTQIHSKKGNMCSGKIVFVMYVH